MPLLKTRMWLSVLASIAFIAPLGAVIAIEHAKNVAKLQNEKLQYQNSLTVSEEARNRYFQNVEAKKTEMKQYMEKSQAEYQALLQNQPDQITAHQTTTTQTTSKPVVVKKSVPITTSSSSQKAATSTKPTSTRTTKTS